MKKKNWIFSLLLAVIILPCMVLLSACGEKSPKITGFSVYIGETLVSENSKTLEVTYGDIDSVSDIKKRISVRLNYDNDEYVIIKSDSGEYSLTGMPSVFNAGTYPISITYEDFSDITINLVIAKANIDMANVQWAYTTPIEFTNGEIKIELSGVPTGVTPNYTNNTATNAGDYVASVSFNYDTTNYNLINNSVENLNWSILKIAPTTPQPESGAIGEKLSTIALPDGWTWDNEDAELTTSGNYKASYAGSTNYKAVSAVDIFVTVKQNPTYSAQTGLTATYGDTLADIDFITSETDTAGTWAWKLPTSTSVGNAGTNTFTAIFTPTDTANYSIKTINIEVVVNKKLITKPTLAQNTFVYDGYIKKPQEIGFDDNVMTRTGAGAVEVSVGYIRFFLKDTANYAWADGTTARLEYEWTITPKLIVKPKVSGTYTYNGEEQTVNITTSDYYTISGNTGTNAGSYTATLTLIDIYNYAWTDNSSTPYNMPWEILKATPTYTAPTSLTANLGDKLSDVSLSSGTGEGVWSWEDPTKSVGNIGTNSFNAIFTPTDATNYKTETVAVDVVVEENQPTSLEQLGFDGIAGLLPTTFEKWSASPYELKAGYADLTETQFDAIIENLNARYNNDADLPTWNGIGGSTEADPNSIPFYSHDEINLTTNDLVYANNNFAPTCDYYISVGAYKLDGNDTIRLVDIIVYAFDIIFVNDNNAEDTIIISTNDQYTGSITWGNQYATYIIDEDNNDLVATFDDSTKATGKINLSARSLTFTYEENQYSFTQKDDFEVDLTTGIELQLYDVYNYFNTNGKFRVSFENYEDGIISILTSTEWSVGEGEEKVNYASMKQEIYQQPETQGGNPIYVGTYETVFDVTPYSNPEQDSNVYIYYSTNSQNLYKTLTLEEFFNLIKDIDNSLSSYEELFSTAQFSYYCFGALPSNSAELLTETQIANYYCQTGEMKIDNEWFTIEGYTSNYGNIASYLFDSEGNMSFEFEGVFFLTPELTFTDYPTIGTRPNYVAWEQESFEAMMGNIYGNSDGGESGGSEQTYVSEDSDYPLIITPTSSTQGNFTWGIKFGTYELSEQSTPSSVVNITITPDAEDSITGTLDRANYTINFTYNSVEYTFTLTSSGGGESSSTTLLEQYNLPTNFKAIWTDMLNQTHTLIKVGDDFYQNIDAEFMSMTYYYKNQADGTYIQYYLDNESWVVQNDGEAISVSAVEATIGLSSYFANSDYLTAYSKQPSKETYDSFTDCRVYELTSVSVIYMHSAYDFIVANFNGTTSGTLLMELNSLDTAETTFAGYGINNLPN